MALAVLIIALPFCLCPNAEFGGTDEDVKAAVVQSRQDYRPWTEPLWKPPSTEIESLLFALQPSIGAGFLGYFFGYVKARKAEQKLGKTADMTVTVKADLN